MGANPVIKKWVKRIGIGLGAVALLATSYVYGNTELRLRRSYAVEATSIVIPTDEASLARGKHVALAIAKCADCHDADMAGKIMADDAVAARLVGPNLTPSSTGIGAKMSDADWIRAIRHGLRPDGTPIIMIPSNEYAALGKDDLAALVAYMKSLPPVERAMPDTKLGPLMRMLLAAGAVPLLAAEKINHAEPLREAPPADVSASYGEYLARSGGCFGCHNEKLTGGPVPGMPPGTPIPTDITKAGLKSYDEASFIAAMRAGKRPNGTEINEFMPWKAMSAMSDTELKALWLFLQSAS